MQEPQWLPRGSASCCSCQVSSGQGRGSRNKQTTTARQRTHWERLYLSLITRGNLWLTGGQLYNFHVLATQMATPKPLKNAAWLSATHIYTLTHTDVNKYAVLAERQKQQRTTTTSNDNARTTFINYLNAAAVRHTRRMSYMRKTLVSTDVFI